MDLNPMADVRATVLSGASGKNLRGNAVHPTDVT